MESERKFLSISENVMQVNLEVAEQDDLEELLMQCINSRTLWFKFTYGIYGAHGEIHPRELLAVRDDKAKLETFVKDKAQELRYADDIRVFMLEPDKVDRKKLY